MPNFELENQYSGLICGIDEAGRGPLSGPVVAAALIFTEKNSSYINELNDSKKLSKKKRENLYNQIITDKNVIYAFSVISAKIIDQINIFEATKLAMQEALDKLSQKPDHILIDGNHKMLNSQNITPVIKGDSISTTIAAASIIAKVERDKIMANLATKYPKYGFEKHSGYGTKAHIEAINLYGPCEEHRLSFAPLSRLNTKKFKL